MSKDVAMGDEAALRIARTMLSRTPPIYVICPGRVFRTDTLTCASP